MHTIINFATKFFEMFTKKQSRHPHQVSQVFHVFRVFQVFHVRFWTTKPPDFGPNPNKPGKPPESSHRHIMATENTQNSNSPTGLRTRYCPVCDSRSFFSAKPTFLLSSIHQNPDIPLKHHPSEPHQIKQSLSKIAVNERAVHNSTEIMPKQRTLSP